MLSVCVFLSGNPKRGRYRYSKEPAEVPEPEMFVQYQDEAYSKPEELDIDTVLENFEKTQSGKKVKKEDLKKVLKKNKDHMGSSLTDGVPKGTTVIVKITSSMCTQTNEDSSTMRNMTDESSLCTLSLTDQNNPTNASKVIAENQDTQITVGHQNNNLTKDFTEQRDSADGKTLECSSSKYDPVISSVVEPVDDTMSTEDKDLSLILEKNCSKVESDSPHVCSTPRSITIEKVEDEKTYEPKEVQKVILTNTNLL